MTSPHDSHRWEIRNEFGTVVIFLDVAANGPRLRLVGQEIGSEIYLDVLEIEALSAMTHEDFAGLIERHVSRASDGS